jgi:hypothetical protein
MMVPLWIFQLYDGAKSNTHSVDIVLWILIFSQASIMPYNTLLQNAGQQQTTATSEPRDQEGKQLVPCSELCC